MGRPANNVPYLIKGTYHIRFQGVKTPFSLSTTNAQEAEKRAIALRRKRGVAAPVAKPTKRKETAPQATKSAAKPPATQGAPSSVPPGPSGEPSLLDDWASTESEFDGAETDETGSGAFVGDDSFSSEGSPDLLPPSIGDTSGPTSAVPWEESKPNSLLTTEEKSRVHGLLAGLVGRINILAVGYAVKVFGHRTPAEPDEKDTALLDKAWSLQLEEWLGDTEIEPKVLILAASAGLGLGMYLGGEPLPPKVVKAKDE